MSKLLRCRFHPQAWINQYAVVVDGDEPDATWEVPWPNEQPIPEDDTYESDELRLAPSAPQWVQDWAGPFYVEVLNRDE